MLTCSCVFFCFFHRRDFAYVARDKNTRVLKCHVFRCDTPAAAIATSLHEICSKVGAMVTVNSSTYTSLSFALKQAFNQLSVRVLLTEPHYFLLVQ